MVVSLGADDRLPRIKRLRGRRCWLYSTEPAIASLFKVFGSDESNGGRRGADDRLPRIGPSPKTSKSTLRSLAMLGSEGAEDFEVVGDGRQGRSRPSPPCSKSFHSKEPTIASREAMLGFGLTKY